VAFLLIYRYFVGLAPSEEPPDHPTLCRFRKRLGPERCEALFNRVVEEARSKGLIHDKLHIIDSTHIEAKVDLFRLKKEEREDNDNHHYIDRSSPDEAEAGRHFRFLETINSSEKGRGCRQRYQGDPRPKMTG